MKLGSTGDVLPGLSASAAIAPNLRVKFDGATGRVAVCGDEDGEIGVTVSRSYRAGDEIAVKDERAPGFHALMAAGAIARGGNVFAAAGGKIGATGTRLVGVAREAAAGDGSVILVKRI